MHLRRLPRLLALPVLCTILLLASPTTAAAADPVILNVPWRTQFDDSPYAAANCGPATIGMILGAFGMDVPTWDLRRIVIQLQGSASYDDGTYIENLAKMAERYGVAGLQLSDDSGSYHHWTLEDIRYQLRAGRPVVPQVHYRSLLGHEDSTYYGDHYIAVVGFDGDDFFYHDPAMRGADSGMRRIGGEQLFLAMKRSDFPFAALSFAAEGGTKGARRLPVVSVLPRPATTVAPTQAVQPIQQAAAAAPPEPTSGTLRRLEPAPPAAPGPAAELAPAIVPAAPAATKPLISDDIVLGTPAWIMALLLPVMMGIMRSRLLFLHRRKLRLPAVADWLPRRSPAPPEARQA